MDVPQDFVDSENPADPAYRLCDIVYRHRLSTASRYLRRTRSGAHELAGGARVPSQHVRPRPYNLSCALRGVVGGERRVVRGAAEGEESPGRRVRPRNEQQRLQEEERLDAAGFDWGKTRRRVPRPPAAPLGQ
jgi:hypothetical protein